VNIGIIGVGGVGGYFGGKLARYANNTSNINVYYVARNKHLKAIKEKGLKLETVEGNYTVFPTAATDNIDELPMLDLCLVCVKSYDLEKIMKYLNKKLTDSTVIMPLLNGIDVVERIRQVTVKGKIYPACVYIGTHISEPGKVSQTGGSCIINYGCEFDDNETRAISNLFEKAGVKSKFHKNPYIPIWEKFIFIAAYGMVTAVNNKVMGAVIEDELLSQDVKGIMQEIYHIAKAMNVILNEDIVSKSFEKGSNFPYDVKTSFQRDYENPSKKDERELFGNTIVRLGEENSINTPVSCKYVELMNKWGEY